MIRRLFFTGLLLTIGLGQVTDSTFTLSDPDSVVISEADTLADSIKVPLPILHPAEEPPPKLEAGKPFFEYKSDLNNLQFQIDSLRQLIEVYQKKQTMPTIKEDLLNLIKLPEHQHRITLQNGTVILGEIISESEDEIILQTNIGRLVLTRESVFRIEEELPLRPRVELVEEPTVNTYPDREVITGKVKNVGKKRGDFVRVIAYLWTKTTDLAAQDSAFVNGTMTKYNSGVITDTALEPDQSAEFKIVVSLPAPGKVAYRTYDIHWEETK